MNIFSKALLQVILISYPLVVYLFYNSSIGENNNKLKDVLIDLSLYTSIYLLSIYASILDAEYYIIINIPILLAYILEKEKEGIILSIMTIVFYYEVLNYNMLYTLIEYSIYYLIYLAYKKYKINNYYYLIFILFIKIISTYILVPDLFINKDIYAFILECILLYTITVFCYGLVNIGDKLIKYSSNLKEIEKEKQIREMIFTVAHEIKNPIAVCKGYLDMINIDNKTKTKKYIENIKNEINKSLALMQDFLSLRKIQINKEMVDVNILLSENLDILKSFAKNNNIILDYELLDEEIYINGDYNRLGQVIINIVKNSIEASNNKGKIKVYTKLDNDYIYVYFVDNGRGISQEDLEKLKKESYTTKVDGNGIGIILSNEIMLAHDGELLYESKLGEGTTTIMKLPLYIF